MGEMKKERKSVDGFSSLHDNMHNTIRICNIRFFAKQQKGGNRNSSRNYLPRKTMHFPIVNRLQLRSIPELIFATKQYNVY